MCDGRTTEAKRRRGPPPGNDDSSMHEPLSLPAGCGVRVGVGWRPCTKTCLPPSLSSSLWSFPLLAAGVRRSAHVFPHKRDDGNDEGMSDAATIGSHGTPYRRREVKEGVAICLNAIDLSILVIMLSDFQRFSSQLAPGIQRARGRSKLDDTLIPRRF